MLLIAGIHEMYGGTPHSAKGKHAKSVSLVPTISINESDASLDLTSDNSSSNLLNLKGTSEEKLDFSPEKDDFSPDFPPRKNNDFLAAKSLDCLMMAMDSQMKVTQSEGGIEVLL